MCILLYTGVNHDQLVDLAVKHFGDVSPNYTGRFPDAGNARFTGSEVRWF